MSDLEAYGDPNHVCGEQCLPHEPISDRDLEKLDESAHIDALYEELNLVREHAALLVLLLAKADGRAVGFSTRSAAVLLDLSEEEAEVLLGERLLHTADAIVDHAVSVAGEEGYIGKAMVALFSRELMDTIQLPDDDGDEG